MSNNNLDFLVDAIDTIWGRKKIPIEPITEKQGLKYKPEGFYDTERAAGQVVCTAPGDSVCRDVGKRGEI